MKHVKLFSAILILALVILSPALVSPRSYRETEFLMDTVMTITAYGSQGKQGVKDAFRRIREIDEKFDLRNPEGQLYAVNNAPKGTPVSVDKDLFFVLKQALEFEKEFAGSFDITLYPLSSLWGFDSETPRLPADRDIAETMEKTGSHGLLLEESNHTVTKLSDSVMLDLGAVAKGYASDEAVRILKEAGVRDAYLDLGGNLALMGHKPQGLWDKLKNGNKSRNFTVGIQKPDAPRGELCDTLSLSDCFIVTSGDYERYFESDGIRYHHLLDPETGYPAKTELRSVTVVADSGLKADMLSTALFVASKKPLPLESLSCSGLITVDRNMTVTRLIDPER